jgi:hypothetical protein
MKAHQSPYIEKTFAGYQTLLKMSKRIPYPCSNFHKSLSLLAMPEEKSARAIAVWVAAIALTVTMAVIATKVKGG